MIPLTKEEVEEIFNYLDNTNLHKTKSLFYKLQYYYARRSEEIVTLKVKDIDFNLNRITINIAKKKKEADINLKLIPKVKDGLLRVIEENNLEADDFIFIEDENKKDTYKRTLRKYLERNSCKITRELFNKEIPLNTHDFRRLGGQHLYLAGYKLEHLQELYQHIDINQTIDYLQIDEIVIDNLLNYYC
ncbi:MAG: tyrosine-type recombinase/integrase [Romboutsia sp.]|nr:tyrosine-type recombinase/integrase [Romboutsia sp.]